MERAVALLGCQLTERSPFGGERDVAALLKPCCGTLSRMLTGITLPPRSPGGNAPRTESSPLPAEALRAQQRLRDHLLIAARCSHVRVKRTKSGAPSRTQLRKFEGEISTNSDSLWAMLETAVEFGLTGGSEHSEFLCPDLARLLDAADRGFIPPASTPTLRAAASWAATGPIPVAWYGTISGSWKPGVEPCASATVWATVWAIARPRPETSRHSSILRSGSGAAS